MKNPYFASSFHAFFRMTPESYGHPRIITNQIGGYLMKETQLRIQKLLWTAVVLGVFAVGILAANYTLYTGAGTENAAAASEAISAE
jgi:hypothetical protein